MPTVSILGLVPPGTRFDWADAAACKEADPDLFFHPQNERGADRWRRDRLAKAICRRCPVIAECRDYSLAAREPYGVWGGMSEDDRLQLN